MNKHIIPKERIHLGKYFRKNVPRTLLRPFRILRYFFFIHTTTCQIHTHSHPDTHTHTHTHPYKHKYSDTYTHSLSPSLTLLFLPFLIVSFHLSYIQTFFFDLCYFKSLCLQVLKLLMSQILITVSFPFHKFKLFVIL